jgi:hypothetical protein
MAPDGDIPVIRVMTREAPLAEHQVKPLNLGEHAQEATALAVLNSMSDRSHFARAALTYALAPPAIRPFVTLR